MHNIIEDLLPLAKPIGTFTLLKDNPRKGDVESVARSFKKFGQRKPIIARLDGTVIAGNHSLMAARTLKWTQIAAVIVDETETESKAFALADNRTSELGSFDISNLAALIEDVMAEDESILAWASYSEDDVERILNAGGFDDLPGDTAGDKEPSSAEQTCKLTVLCSDELEQETIVAILADNGYTSIKKGKCF